MIEDLQTTLKINKGIIKNLIDQKKGLNQVIEYTFNQLNHENELLENKLKRIQEERDSLQARMLILQQIVEDTKDKEDDVAEMFKDEIEELKENLERKEYLLQVNEQRYGEFEKILIDIAEQDTSVRKRLADLNLVPKDRKISNVILENTNYKQQVEELKYENDKLRDHIDQIVSQAHGMTMNQEELSIFQTKNPHNMPKLDLNKLQRQESDQRDYIKKLEQSVQYLNDKITKIRIDYKNLKKENQNLKDSNENHIFINEKLNQALKKSSQRIEDLEKRLDGKVSSRDNAPSKEENQSKQGSTEGQQIEMIDSKKQQSKESTLESNTSQKTTTVLQQKGPVMGGMKLDEKALNYESSFGDVSSIMIMPDQMYNNFNLLEDENEGQEPQKQNPPQVQQTSSNGRIAARKQ
ncbi:UNKNOWN [Stylonychia lemnae]|uniref:Uncharacterized protein n=1 Tax=Stylonychia lemnae TaxID=5949 RepID=A0A078A0T6_STYLE|nr:UNKNOWN [Stylonychia lemnae]|eukprot:CDW75472.1 UNKNOWN [Stylonychia lemnae]